MAIMETEIKEGKNGLKLLKFPKPASDVVAVFDTKEEAEEAVAEMLIKEVEAEKSNITRLLILFETKDGELRWVGNQRNRAEQAWFMEEVKFAMIEEEVLGEDEPEPPQSA